LFLKYIKKSKKTNKKKFVIILRIIVMFFEKEWLLFSLKEKQPLASIKLDN